MFYPKKKIDRFIEEAKKQCEVNGIDFVLTDREHVLWEGFKCAGYFHHKKKVLAVATKNPWKVWLPTLIHEFCHMKQWELETTSWVECFEGGKDVNDIIDVWLNGDIELDEKTLWDYITRILNNERECEAMTIGLLKSFGFFGLLFNRKSYIRSANTYFVQWVLTGLLREWPTDRPYKHRSIRKTVPNKDLLVSIKKMRKLGLDNWSKWKKVFPRIERSPIA